MCDTSCNNKACGNNDCTGDQVKAACVPEHDISGIDYTSAPADSSGSVKVDLQLNLDPSRLQLEEELNEYFLLQVAWWG